MHYSSAPLQIEGGGFRCNRGTRSGMVTEHELPLHLNFTGILHGRPCIIGNTRSKMTEDTYGRKTPTSSVHRRHGGDWMYTIVPAPNYITNWSRHPSCLSTLNHSYSVLPSQFQSAQTSHNSSVGYCTFLFPPSVVLTSLTTVRTLLSTMRLLAFLFALLTFCPGSFAFLFWWWIPLPIFVINGHNANSNPPCYKTQDYYNGIRDDCVNHQNANGASIQCDY